MRSSLHPGVVAALLVAAFALATFLVWRNSGGINTGPGRLQSDLNSDAAVKQAAQNPEEFRKKVDESIRRDAERKARP